MKYIKTCKIIDIYPEVVKAHKVTGIYHHFITGDGKTESYPVKSFPTLELCEANHKYNNEVKP